MFELHGKRALVTGSGCRIGREIALSLAQKGMKIILHYNQSQKEAELLFKALGGSQNGHCLYGCDFADSAQIADFWQMLETPISVLINNASVYQNCLLKGEALTQIKHQFDVNFFTPWQLMQLFANQPHLEQGVILNLLDADSAQNRKIGGSYALSKSVFQELTCQAALQWAPQIRVNGVALGAVLPPKNLPHAKMIQILKRVPMQKSVEMSDLISGVHFLLNNESITGQILYLDGGLHLN